MTVWTDFADAVRDLAHGTAREASPPVERWKVTSSDPLVIEQVEGDVVLEEGDDDVEFERSILADRPDEGDTVRVHSDGSDWIVSGVIEGGDS